MLPLHSYLAISLNLYLYQNVDLALNMDLYLDLDLHLHTYLIERLFIKSYCRQVLLDI